MKCGFCCTCAADTAFPPIFSLVRPLFVALLSCTKISIPIFTPEGVSVVVWGGGATTFIWPQVSNRTYWEKHSQSFVKRERKQLWMIGGRGRLRKIRGGNGLL
ncbi:hypothetical protein TNIN_47801 [Trichonephila inaurata madagascariensis]|uniref:Uncharacterized protein n=1 Tax=Trichonephila inaurata madagascariensis TaxID=2747483 RepID=A0A8X7CL54_9ARAC|nr:hypothetical protein TNIN_47801 [Trichonephila inaurata madagascariensis]